MAEVRHLGHFPFCIRERAEDGQPFQVWDGSTFHTIQYTEDGGIDPDSQWIYQDIGGITGGLGSTFGKTPSKSSSKLITVYGSGTRYFIGPLSLEELMYFYWRPKKYTSTINGEYTTSIDGITNTYGNWETVGTWPNIQYVWVSETETLNGITKSVKYPDDAGTNVGIQGQITEYTRLTSPPDLNLWPKGPLNETQLVCSPFRIRLNFGTGGGNNAGAGVWGDFPYFQHTMSAEGSNLASEGRIGEVRLNIQAFSGIGIIDYRQAIKVGNDSYYLPFGEVNSNGSLLFNSVGLQIKCTQTQGPFPDTYTLVEYNFELFAYTFPYAGDGLPNPLYIQTGNPPPTYLSDKEISMTFNFPSGAKTFKTRVFMCDWSAYELGQPNETIIHKTDGPMLNMSIDFPEHFEYDPNDGGGPIYDKTTGAKIRTDRGMGPPWSSQ